MIVSQIRAIAIPAILGVGILSSGTSVTAFQLADEKPTGDGSQQIDQGGTGTTTQRGRVRPTVSPEENKPVQPTTDDDVPPSPGNLLPTPRPGGRRIQPSTVDDERNRKDEQPLARISEEEVAFRQLKDNAILARLIAESDVNPKTKKILSKLDEPIIMSFRNETPLEDFLKYIESATSDKEYGGIPIHVDSRGLEMAEKTMQSPVTIKLAGVSLKTTLRLALKPIGLAYCVHDGFLMISSPEGIREELEEARIALGLPAPAEVSSNPFEGMPPYSLDGMSGGMMSGGMMSGGMK